MSEPRERGRHRGPTMAASCRVARHGKHTRQQPAPLAQLFISRARSLSRGARRHMVPLIIVQFVINILLALLLNNQPQPRASPVGSSLSSGAPAQPSTWLAHLPDSRNELPSLSTSPHEASGVKFELFRGDKSSAASSSSSPAVQMHHSNQRPRPHWRWLLANELAREVRMLPALAERELRHGNLLTIDEDEQEEKEEEEEEAAAAAVREGGEDEADYDADNENSVRSRLAPARVLGLPGAGLIESKQHTRASGGGGEVGSESNPTPPAQGEQAADLLKLKRRRRHHAHQQQEHDLIGIASLGSTSLTSALDQNGGSPDGRPSASSSPLRSQQIKTREQIQIAEQAYRSKLMELKQKYMTNRAINDLAYYVLLTIYALLITFGTISNSLICMTVILKPKILSPRNIFIVNLAGSDLLLCVFTMPFSFIEISMKMWQMGLIPCKLVSALQATSIFVSTISITAIALDRYKVIVYPTHQETASGARGAFLLLASVWIGALLLSLPLFWFRTVENYDNLLPQNGSLAHHGLRSSSGQQQQQQQQAAMTSPDSSYHNNSSLQQPKQQQQQQQQANVTTQLLRPVALNQHDTIESIDFCVEKWPFDHGRGIYSVVSMIFQYVLPITIVGVVYTKISHKLQKRLIRRQRLTQLECQQKRQLNLIKRTHTMLISVSLVFGLSWLPLNLLNVISDFSPWFRQLLDDQSLRVTFAICHLIGCSSACSNPVLYGFLNENFRKELRQVYNYYARRLVRLVRRLVGCRCCWLTRKVSQRCFGSRIDLGAEGDDEEDEGPGRGETGNKQNDKGEEGELTIKLECGDSLSGGALNSTNNSSSSYSSSSSSSSSGFDSSSSSAPETPSRACLGQQPASSLSLNVQIVGSGDVHHSMRSLPNEINVQTPLTPIIRTSNCGGEQVAAMVADGTTPATTSHQRPSIQQSVLDAARRLSYQTIASSRHTMGGRTMRLCLCISGSSSAETLGGVGTGANAVPVAINGIKLSQLPPTLDFGCEEQVQLETRLDDDQYEAENKQKLDRKRRRQRRERRRQKEELAQLKCQCQCHSANANRQATIEEDHHKEDSKSERYVDLASETCEKVRRRTKFDSKSLDDERQTNCSLGQAAGRRVWLRFLAGSGGGGGGGGTKSSGCGNLAAVLSGGRATDATGAAQVQGEDGHSMIDKTKTKRDWEKDEGVKRAEIVPFAHCNNCKHSSAKSSGGVTSSASLKRLSGVGSETGISYRRKQHRDRGAKRGARGTKSTAKQSPAKQTPGGALPSMAAAHQRATTATKRRPLMSSLMSSFRLTRSSASSQDGEHHHHHHHHHQVPLRNSNVADQYQLPTLRSSQGSGVGVGEMASLAPKLISTSRSDKRHAEQKKQVGTVYLSIEMPSRARGDSFVSTLGRERSTSVVVLGYEESGDDQNESCQNTQVVEVGGDEPILGAEKLDVFEQDGEQVASSQRKLDTTTEKESSTTTLTSRTHNKPTAGEEEGEGPMSQVIVHSQNSPSASSPSSSASSSSSSSSSFTSACLLHSSSVFSSSCTCSTASSCSQTTSTNCHLTVGPSSMCSSGPQLIVQQSGAALSVSMTAACGRQEKRRSQSHKRSSLALVTASQSGQDFKLLRHSVALDKGVPVDRKKVGHKSPTLLSATTVPVRTSEAINVWPRARSATAGSDLSASAQAARANLIGQCYGLRPTLATAAPSISSHALQVSSAPAAATTSSCSIFTTGVTTTSRSSLTSFCELSAADGNGEQPRERRDSANATQDDVEHKDCCEVRDRKMAPPSLCNGHLQLAPATNTSSPSACNSKQDNMTRDIK